MALDRQLVLIFPPPALVMFVALEAMCAIPFTSPLSDLSYPLIFALSFICQLEAAVRELPGVVSCSLTPAYHLSSNSSSSNSRGSLASASIGTHPVGLGNLDRYPGVTTYLLTASLSLAPLTPQLPLSGSGSEAIWAVLGEAYDGEGKRRFSGVRDVLEAVRGRGYEVRVLGSGTGDALTMEASQARVRLTVPRVP